MDNLKQYVIPFAGLSNGDHTFEFHVNDEFFENFDNTLITRCDVNVTLRLEKLPRVMNLTFHMRGTIHVECSRCLDEFEYPVDHTDELYVKFGDTHQEQAENVLVLTDKEHQLDVAPYIYEYITLLLPYRVVHPDNADGTPGCDPDVLKRLEELSVKQGGDPRWDKLKDIKFD